MARPRRIVPGATYFLTRRCYQRTFRLRPSDETNRIYKYCLALAMQKTGVLVHAVCVMSNHHHLVVTDPRGVLPEFLRELHRLVAKTVNASQGESENLWAAETPSAVRLVADEDIEDKIAYVTSNPVSAGLVKHPEEWPGFVCWGERTFVVERPPRYFREDGTCPCELSLALTPPPQREASPDLSEWKKRVADRIAQKVSEGCRRMMAAGRTFLGRKAVLASSFLARATSREKRGDLVPTFAAKCQALREQLRVLEREFRASYRGALDEWRAGIRTAVFPHGTWWMRVMHGAAVEGPLPM